MRTDVRYGRGLACGMRRGFTLIELLVVIAIIATLATILFPVFARARAKALQSSCTSNVRNVVQAIIQYAQDWDERLVFWRTPCWLGGPQFTYDPPVPIKVNTYVKSGPTFQCPATGRDWSWPTGGGRPNWWTCGGRGYGDHPWIRRPDWIMFTSYGYNEFVQNDGESYTKMAIIKRPTEFVILGDSEAAVFTPWGFDQWWGISPNGIVRRLAFAEIYPPPLDSDLRADEFTRHMGGSVLAFVDSHVKWYPWRQIRMVRYNGVLRFMICDDTADPRCWDPNFWR